MAALKMSTDVGKPGYKVFVSKSVAMNRSAERGDGHPTSET